MTKPNIGAGGRVAFALLTLTLPAMVTPAVAKTAATQATTAKGAATTATTAANGLPATATHLPLPTTWPAVSVDVARLRSSWAYKQVIRDFPVLMRPLKTWGGKLGHLRKTCGFEPSKKATAMHGAFEDPRWGGVVIVAGAPAVALVRCALKTGHFGPDHTAKAFPGAKALRAMMAAAVWAIAKKTVVVAYGRAVSRVRALMAAAPTTWTAAPTALKTGPTIRVRGLHRALATSNFILRMMLKPVQGSTIKMTFQTGRIDVALTIDTDSALAAQSFATALPMVRGMLSGAMPAAALLLNGMNLQNQGATVSGRVSITPAQLKTLAGALVPKMASAGSP